MCQHFRNAACLAHLPYRVLILGNTSLQRFVHGMRQRQHQHQERQRQGQGQGQGAPAYGLSVRRLSIDIGDTHNLYLSSCVDVMCNISDLRLRNLRPYLNEHGMASSSESDVEDEPCPFFSLELPVLHNLVKLELRAVNLQLG